MRGDRSCLFQSAQRSENDEPTVNYVDLNMPMLQLWNVN